MSAIWANASDGKCTERVAVKSVTKSKNVWRSVVPSASRKTANGIKCDDIMYICVASLCRAATLRNLAADVLSRKRSQQPFECIILSLRRRPEKVRITYNHNDDKFIIAFLDFCVAFHSPVCRSYSVTRTHPLCPSQSLNPNSFLFLFFGFRNNNRRREKNHFVW